MTDPRGIGHLGGFVPKTTAFAVRTVGGQIVRGCVGQFEDDDMERIDGKRGVVKES